MSAEIDDVILLSSDSSAPNSPTAATKSKDDDKFENDDAASDSTEIYCPTDQQNQSLVDGNHIEPNTENIGSDNESNITLEDFPPVNFSEYSENEAESNGKQQYQVHELSDSDCDSTQPIKGSDKEIKKLPTILENGSEKGTRKRKAKNPDIEEERERKKAQRLLKQVQKAQDKAIKQANAETIRSKRPEECLKLIRVCLDHQLLVSEYGGQLLVSLQAAEMQYNIQTNPVPFSIVWTRETQEHFVGADFEVRVKSSVKDEDDVIIVWKWEKVIKLIHSGELTSEIQVLQSDTPGKTFTLVIYGAETKDYFKYKKTAKNREFKAQVAGESKAKPNKKEANFEKVPQVSRTVWEEALTELQLFGCNHVLVDNPESLGTYVSQFTKAIAEAPFKQEKREQVQDEMECFGDDDSRDCVRVDKNGNGLLRLWQQQLCQFNSVSMETAQAIASVYKSPTALVTAYENCSSEKEGQLLLAKIPVRRGVGPLTTDKAVGPELSKKIYSFFTAVDGEIELSDE